MADKDKKKISLNNNFSDYLVAFSKSFLYGLPIESVPNAGPLMAEIIGVIIPNQRSDRFAKYLQEVESRVVKLEEKVSLKDFLKDENFIDLIEESTRNAVRALSENRLKYIASLLVNGIKSEDISIIESKHLLRILGELNDPEIIWLQSFTLEDIESIREFHIKHKEVLEPIRAYIGSSQASHDKDALQKSYQEHLAQLGLLDRRYEVNTRNQLPEADGSGPKSKIKGYEITTLGKLILKQIGLIENSK